MVKMRKEFQVFHPILHHFGDYYFDNYCFHAHSVPNGGDDGPMKVALGGDDTFHSRPSVTDHLLGVREKKELKKRRNLSEECDEWMEDGEK